MDFSVKIQNSIRSIRRWRLRSLIKGDHPSAERVSEAVSEIIRHAERDEQAGVRRDRWLFAFESEYEEISDAIGSLKDDGETDAYRNVCGKLYEFCAKEMEGGYMPLYLSVIYRYANALLDTGEAEEAVRLFEELLSQTDRLIGADNTYGIHCLERIADAAVKCGQTAKAEDALKKMSSIAAEEFGPGSAMAQAVQSYAERLRENENNTK